MTETAIIWICDLLKENMLNLLTIEGGQEILEVVRDTILLIIAGIQFMKSI
jgi:hypothetical protein